MRLLIEIPALRFDDEGTRRLGSLELWVAKGCDGMHIEHSHHCRDCGEPRDRGKDELADRDRGGAANDALNEQYRYTTRQRDRYENVETRAALRS